jgi:hypothetical protein
VPELLEFGVLPHAMAVAADVDDVTVVDIGRSGTRHDVVPEDLPALLETLRRR